MTIPQILGLTMSNLLSLSRRVLMLAVLSVTVASAKASSFDVTEDFLKLFTNDPQVIDKSLETIEKHWEPGFVTMTLETIRLTRNPFVAHSLVRMLTDKTGQSFGFDIQKWQEWVWNEPEQRYTKYASFKSSLYGLIDSRFSNYFEDTYPAEIRLDEVVWGGVRQDGIPPLRGPKMLQANQAEYLEDNHVVFGISVNGDTRAYPKRILAWHEMFVDEVGGVPVAGVYCTLCGTVILYKTQHNGVNHVLGTSGFLYRSNKLMYDRDTQSLWNTLWGEPVIGPLVGRGIKLDFLGVVTTTWGEWHRRHPDTLVLSLETGHTRDYSEGAAYREYFSTDELMFTVPKLDSRLLNKQEIFAVILSEHPDKPLAISADFLLEHPVYHDQINGLRFVVLTDNSGANRLYQAGNKRFISWDGDKSVTDESSSEWTVTENALESSEGEKLYRLPGYRAFWFGWYSAYPHTSLVN